MALLCNHMQTVDCLDTSFLVSEHVSIGFKGTKKVTPLNLQYLVEFRRNFDWMWNPITKQNPKLSVAHMRCVRVCVSGRGVDTIDFVANVMCEDVFKLILSI